MAALRSSPTQSQSRVNKGAVPPPASAPLLSTDPPSASLSLSTVLGNPPLSSGSVSTSATDASMIPSIYLPPSGPADSPSYAADDRHLSTNSSTSNVQIHSTVGHNVPSQPQQQQQHASTAGPPTSDQVEAVIKLATSTRPTPDGRPPPGKDTRTQLFVGNLPYRVRWQDLKDLFRKAGTVLRADVALTPAYPSSTPSNPYGSLSTSPNPSAIPFSSPFHPNHSPFPHAPQNAFNPSLQPPTQVPQKSLGYGTVLLSSAEDAGRAVDMFNGFCWQGRTLEVRLDRLAPEVDSGVNLGMMPVTNAGVPGANKVSPTATGALPGVNAAALAALSPATAQPGAGANLPIAALANTLGNLSLNQLNQLANLGQLGTLAQLASAGATGGSAGNSVGVSPVATSAQDSGRSRSSSSGASNSAHVTPAPGGGMTVTLSGAGGMEGGAFHVPAPVHAQALKSLSSGLGNVPMSSVGFGGNGNGGTLGALRGDPLLGLHKSPLPSSNGVGGASFGASMNGLGQREEGQFDAAGLMARGRSPWLPGYERPNSGLAPLGIGKSLFVGNLPFHTQWQDLKDLFRQAAENGPILRADVNLGPDGRSRGFGTVSFASDDDAQRAVNMFNGTEYCGRLLRVHFDKYSSSTPVSAANLGNLNLGMRSSPLNLSQQQAYGQTNFGINASPFSQIQQQQQQVPSMTAQGISNEAIRDALTTQQYDFQRPQHRSQHSGSGLLGGDISTYDLLQKLEHEDSECLSRNDMSVGLLSNMVSKSRRGSSSTNSRSGSFGAGSSLLSSFETFRSSDTSSSVHSLSAPPVSQQDLERSFDSALKVTPPPTSASTMLPTTLSPSSPTSSSAQRRNSNSGLGSRSAAQASLSLLTNSHSQAHSPRGAAHPGPISLPPPTVVAGFPVPMQHTLSPLLASPLHPYPQQTTPGPYPQSPYAHHAMYALPGQPPVAYSPLHHPAHGVLMTPHGIPPITPSMPSFSFAAQPTPIASMGGLSIASPPPHPHGAYVQHHPHHSRYASHGAPMSQHPGLVHTASFSPGMMMSPVSGPYYGPPAPIGKASGSGLRHGGETIGEGTEGDVNDQQGMCAPPMPQYVQHGMGSPGYFMQMEPNGYFPPMPPPEEYVLRDQSVESGERRRLSSSSVVSDVETDFGMDGVDAQSSAATSRTGDEGNTPESMSGDGEMSKEKMRTYSMSSGDGLARDRDSRPAMQKTHSDETPGHAQMGSTHQQQQHQTRSRSVTDKDVPSLARPPPVLASHSEPL